MHISLGKVVVTTPGVPVRATINRPDPALPYYVHAYSVQRLAANVGTVYVSLSPTDDRVALSQCLGTLDKSMPAYSAGVTVEVNGINLAEIYFDADQAGDGVIIGGIIS